jgi:hypothetical protein
MVSKISGNKVGYRTMQGRRARAERQGGKALLWAVVGGVALSSTPMMAEDLHTSRFGLYGSAGLLDMPTAETAPDGQLSLSHTRFGPVRRTTLAFQILPRLSGSLSYSGTDNLTDEFDVYWDRTFDLSYQLFDEGTYRPAVSVGLRDLMGTSLLGSEYIVATKSVGERLRVTGGLGWGRLATQNDLGFSIGNRDGDLRDTGGTLNFDQWFRGPVGAFGGVSYDLNDKLTVLAEYSSDAYLAETERGIVTHNSPFNVGLSYHITPHITATASYLYGDMFGFGITGFLNPKTPAVKGGLETAPTPVMQRPSRSADALGWSGAWIEDGTDAPAIRKALARAMAKEGLELEAMSLTATRAEVRFNNTRFAARAEALGRLSRLMSRAFPPSVETFVMTEVVEGVPTQSTIVPRTGVERLEFEPAGKMLAVTQFADPRALPSDPLVRLEDVYPRLHWSVSPYLTASVFDPESPLRADIGLRGKVNYELMPGLSLRASTSVRLSGNIADEDVSVEDTTLPPVRSEAPYYSNQVQLENLTANWYGHPAENIFTRASVGYLERMYGGVSGEVLWKKSASRLALGAEVNYALKRDFDDLFGFGDYDIVTGHVSGYYDMGNGFHGQVDVGRYLAGDWGATFSVDREFNNGWRVGAYATLTDVPFDEFGEGSFDKGIRISMPSDWFAGTPTTERNDFLLQSLTRDGGARLNVQGRLYERIRGTQQPEIEDRWGRYWR